MTGGQIDLLGAPDEGGERDDLERYFTPPWATAVFADYMGSRLSGTLWDPCCGQGTMAAKLCALRRPSYEGDPKGLTPLYVSDVAPDCAYTGAQTWDFLQPELPPWHDEPPDWIVTNPPYTLRDPALKARGEPSLVATAADFVRLSLQRATRGVAMLLRIAWLEPADERAELLQGTPCTDLVILPRVHYLGAPDNNNQTSLWFVWDKATPWVWPALTLDEHREGAGWTKAAMTAVRHYTPGECYVLGRR